MTPDTTPLTPSERIVLSAWFARSNMGQERASRKSVERLLASKHLTLDSAVTALCEQFMESDDHYDLWITEAQGWFNDYFAPNKEYATREAIIKTWPDTKLYFWPE